MPALPGTLHSPSPLSKGLRLSPGTRRLELEALELHFSRSGVQQIIEGLQGNTSTNFVPHLHILEPGVLGAASGARCGRFVLNRVQLLVSQHRRPSGRCAIRTDHILMLCWETLYTERFRVCKVKGFVTHAMPQKPCSIHISYIIHIAETLLMLKPCFLMILSRPTPVTYAISMVHPKTLRRYAL